MCFLQNILFSLNSARNIVLARITLAGGNFEFDFFQNFKYEPQDLYSRDPCKVLGYSDGR